LPQHPKITTDFTKPWLILGEGESDKFVFESIVSGLGLADFQVEFPRLKADDTGGIGRFAFYLALLSISQSAVSKLKAILLVVDNDEHPDRAFKSVQKIIRSANKQMPKFIDNPKLYAIPAKPLEPAISPDGAPTVIVMMLPWTDERGALETLCLPAFYGKWKKVWASMEADLDNFVNTSPASGWETTDQSKARMQCSIAATCEKDPNTPLNKLFKRPKKYHFSTKHPTFNRVKKFLMNFGNLIP